MVGYIIEFIGEYGSHYTVKKVFTTFAKADAYMKSISYISHSMHLPSEKVISRSISKVEII